MFEAFPGRNCLYTKEEELDQQHSRAIFFKRDLDERLFSS